VSFLGCALVIWALGWRLERRSWRISLGFLGGFVRAHVPIEVLTRRLEHLWTGLLTWLLSIGALCSDLLSSSCVGGALLEHGLDFLALRLDGQLGGLFLGVFTFSLLLWICLLDWLVCVLNLRFISFGYSCRFCSSLALLELLNI